MFPFRFLWKKKPQIKFTDLLNICVWSCLHAYTHAKLLTNFSNGANLKTLIKYKQTCSPGIYCSQPNCILQDHSPSIKTTHLLMLAFWSYASVFKHFFLKLILHISYLYESPSHENLTCGVPTTSMSLFRLRPDKELSSMISSPMVPRLGIMPGDSGADSKLSSSKAGVAGVERDRVREGTCGVDIDPSPTCSVVGVSSGVDAAVDELWNNKLTLQTWSSVTTVFCRLSFIKIGCCDKKCCKCMNIFKRIDMVQIKMTKYEIVSIPCMRVQYHIPVYEKHKNRIILCNS